MFFKTSLAAQVTERILRCVCRIVTLFAPCFCFVLNSFERVGIELTKCSQKAVSIDRRQGIHYVALFVFSVKDVVALKPRLFASMCAMSARSNKRELLFNWGCLWRRLLLYIALLRF